MPETQTGGHQQHLWAFSSSKRVRKETEPGGCVLQICLFKGHLDIPLLRISGTRLRLNASYTARVPCSAAKRKRVSCAVESQGCSSCYLRQILGETDSAVRQI